MKEYGIRYNAPYAELLLCSMCLWVSAYGMRLCGLVLCSQTVAAEDTLNIVDFCLFCFFPLEIPTFMLFWFYFTQ